MEKLAILRIAGAHQAADEGCRIVEFLCHFDDAALEGGFDGFGAVGGAKLFKDNGVIKTYRFFTEAGRIGNFFIGKPFGHKGEDFRLPLRVKI